MNKNERDVAVKEAKAAMQPGYIQIEFGYSTKYIFTHAAGIQVIEAFAKAEEVDGSDYKHPAIIPIASGPTITVLPREKYINMKVTHLLGLNKDEDDEET